MSGNSPAQFGHGGLAKMGIAPDGKRDGIHGFIWLAIEFVLKNTAETAVLHITLGFQFASGVGLARVPGINDGGGIFPPGGMMTSPIAS